jgi:hypothetical protein
VNQSIEEVLKKIRIADMTESTDGAGESKKILGDLVTLG